MSEGKVQRAFDEAYYARFYGDASTRVGTAQSTARLATFVASYLKHLGIEVKDALDFGCGLGLWRAPLERAFPGLRYHGVELSAHMCELRGWAQGSVVDYQHGCALGLVVCQGVLQYLDAHACRLAIDNLARHCEGGLYLEALSEEDWEQSCDQQASDGEVYLRPARWYRQLLAHHFRSCGGGLYLPRDQGTVLYELERGLDIDPLDLR